MTFQKREYYPNISFFFLKNKKRHWCLCHSGQLAAPVIPLEMEKKKSGMTGPDFPASP